MNAIEAIGLRKTYPGGVRGRQGHRLRRSPPARCSACSAPTAPASRPRSGCSRRRSRRPAGSARLAGYDVAPRPARGAQRQQRRVPGGGRRPRPDRPRATSICTRGCGASAARRRRGPDRRARRGARRRRSCSTAPSRATAAAQRRRLEIARALVSQPQVLFLDEPTVGLDPRIRHELLDVIAGLRARDEHDDPAHDPLPRRGAAAVRPRRDHPPRRDRRARHARRAARRPRRRDPRAARRRRRRGRRSRRCARAVSPATTRSRSARR